MKQVVLDIEINADQAVVWHEDSLYLLDQRVLPQEEIFVHCETVKDARNAIRAMVVRGAPAIGVTAAYAVVLAARESWATDGRDWKKALTAKLDMLAQARPTAINDERTGRL